MIFDGHSLPWYLIGVLVTALSAVFYAMLRGKILSAHVSNLLRESAEKRAEAAEAATRANTETVKSLVDSVGKLMVYAENQDKVLRSLSRYVSRDDAGDRGGPA